MAKLNLLGVAIVARDLIEKGWTKGTWHRPGWRDGEAVDFVCTEGAVQLAMRQQIASEINLAGGPICQQLNALEPAERKRVIEQMSMGLSQPREKAVFGYMCKMLGVPSIPGWNDNAKRTKDEVLRLFDNLIAELEQSQDAGEPVEFEYSDVPNR